MHPTAVHRRRSGPWIDDWDPEDPVFWATTGTRVARRNLAPSIAVEFLGFSVWQLWSVVAVCLPAAGFGYTEDELFWLVAVPSLVGATLRVPYTLAVQAFGGRNWTVVSALLLLLPAAALAFFVERPATPFPVMMAVAALAGLGGANFASSMANISHFYPEREKGWVLGLNAAAGNLGVSFVQLVVPVLVVAGGLHLHRAGHPWIPLIALAAFVAWRRMDNLTVATTGVASSLAAARVPHTWAVSLLYVGTFGSFIGYSAAFPLLVASSFPDVPLAHVAFLGAFVGSLSRPLGGKLADALGGARVTTAAFVVMAAGATGVIWALHAHSFGLFLGMFLILFVASGAGNGSTFRMISAGFHVRAVRDGADEAARVEARREAAACIGIASAVGAYGGFLVPRGLAVSMTHFASLVPAFAAIIGVYALCLLLTWAWYVRPGSPVAGGSV
jgi:NNP family nitrate/nitrite transporter-like MFS transporter